MCTLSVIPKENSAYLIAMNRDERRTRQSALPFHEDRNGFSYPTDPQGGGTWIGFNKKGLTLALLNQYNASYPAETDTSLSNVPSRGVLIPELLKTSSIDVLETDLSKLLARYGFRFKPFLLIAVSATPDGLSSMLWDGQSISKTSYPYKPTLFSSSALNAELALPLRQKSFDGLLLNYTAPTKAQLLTLHQSQIPGLEHLSIRMERAEAKTVSISILEYANGKMEVDYYAV